MVWDTGPFIIQFGQFGLRYYSLLFAIAFFLGFVMVKKMFEQEGRDTAPLETVLIYLIVGTTIGARLGHCLFYEPEYYLKHPLEIFMIWEGGLASHGGTIGVLIALYMAQRKFKFPSLLWLMDRVSIPVSLGSAFIRLGNLFNSEIVGKPTDVPWAVVFKKVDLLPRHPSQVYEAICYFLIFIFLLSCYQSPRLRRSHGFFVGFMFFGIFTSRFFIEFTKEPQAAFERGMSLDMGQLLSLPFIVLGIVQMIYSFRKSSPITPIPKAAPSIKRRKR